MSIALTLKKSVSPTYAFTKSFASGELSLDGAFKNEEPDDLNPSVLVNVSYNTAKDYNYAELMGTSYFITGRTIVNANMTLLSLHKDVIVAHKTGILANKAMLDRQQSKAVGNVYIDDSSLVVKRTRLQTQPFSNVNHTETIILCVAGK